MANILLVNPWIYDFAAYDFGIKPVGLLRVGEYLRRRGNEVQLVDCLEGCATKRDRHGFSKIKKEEVGKPAAVRTVRRPFFRYGVSLTEFDSRLERIKNVDEIFVTSGMTYWYPGVRLAIALLKERFPGANVTLGGCYATLCHAHASSTSGAHKVWKGDYPGASHGAGDFYPAYDLLVDKGVLPIQLTRGCPFRCSYCAAHLLAPAFTVRDPAALFAEVMRYRTAFGTKRFVFYDDALAHRSDEGLKIFLRMVVQSGPDITFYTPNGIHARFIDEELAGLMMKAHFREVRLSAETTDEGLQRSTGGKVTTSELTMALKLLKNAGCRGGDIGVYLMIGAPWLDIEKTMRDIEFVHSLGAKVDLASYSPIPGTRDYEDLVASGTIPPDLDPLWHNKSIFADLLDSSYSEKVREVRLYVSKLNRAMGEQGWQKILWTKQSA